MVGTHALLGKSIKFRDLGLLIVDEEQHFGVSHKERLKQLRAQVHVLTLSATPIPRTLQLALTGVRDLSIIASPPVDRLAVRTFVAPHDPLMIREALLRERYRGGQAFYVVPRIEDLAGVKDFLDKNVPEMKVAVAHGQMPPTVIEDIMSAFYDGKYDILLSTTIIESGLDIPTANTLIVHRADMFGLAQLYQLRGRVGRSKLRAYALFTLPAQQKITAQAERRLKVLQSLETLGAGFQLASHDLDIRGAGNLLGEEQSGHIKEVGFELYQSMLEEAILNLKAGVAEPAADRWSPQITIGMPVLIPEDYVNDLAVRLSLYRRLADLETDEEIDNFAAEMRDRFGVLPDEVRYLFKVAAIKAYCRRANVEKVDAGPKGAVITFRENKFAQPDRLVFFIRQHGQAAKVRPDMKVVFLQEWKTPEERSDGHDRDPAATRQSRREQEGGVDRFVGSAERSVPTIRAPKEERWARRSRAVCPPYNSAASLLRILEFRRGLQRFLGGVHRRHPFVVLGVALDAHGRRRYRNIVLAHAEEAADRQDQRVDLVALDGDVGDLADQLFLLVIDVQALQFRREHFVLRHRREFRFRRRGADGLGFLREYRACEHGQRSGDQCNFLHIVLQCRIADLQCGTSMVVPVRSHGTFTTRRVAPLAQAATAATSPNRSAATLRP